MAYVTDKAHPTGWGLPQGINAMPRAPMAPVRRPAPPAVGQLGPALGPAATGNGASFGAAPAAAAGMQGAMPGSAGPQPGQQLGLMNQGANQQAVAQAAQQMQAAPAPSPPQMGPAATAIQGNQQATAQAAQQMQQSHGPTWNNMMDAGQRGASQFQGLGQIGDQMAAQQNQMSRQADLARAAAMRNTRTPSGMMGQLGTMPQTPQAQNPFAGMLSSMGAASRARGWGSDENGNFNVSPGAMQNPDWQRMMGGVQGGAAGGMPAWAQQGRGF